VAQVLAIAEAFTTLPQRPRRSVLALFVAAEEQGLLGSAWYCANPTVAPGRIAANINIDGGTIFGRTTDVGVIGKGKSDLESLLEVEAVKQGRTVVNEPSPDKGYYYRSDQINFAKIGVPALYFRSGQNYRDRPAEWGREQEDQWRATKYHQPSDQLSDEWNLDGMVEDAQLAFLVGLRVAERVELPQWTPGDEFESIRQRALSELEGAR
jgi:Zn-dependent M28 family amino/carboxypeptidase